MYYMQIQPIDTPGSNKDSRSMVAGRDRRLHQLLLGSKLPLEKSHSMPDMQTKKKKKERLRV